MDVALSLQTREAVLLCHALIEHLARSLGVRVLFVKGPGAYEQGLRLSNSSSDVDVLVPPQDTRSLVMALESRGWYLRPGSHRVQGAPLHSVTLINDSWNCDVDVHHRFPGIGISPEAAFERMWWRHEDLELAARSISVPCREDAIVVLALHALRPDFRVSRDFTGELNHLTDVAREMPQGTVLKAARALGADGCALPFLRGFNPPDELADPSPIPADWQLREASTRLSTHSSLWLLSLRKSPLRRRPQILFRAIWPTAYDIAASDRAAGPPHRTIFRARLSRWGRGIAKLPVYASDLRRLKRHKKRATG